MALTAGGFAALATPAEAATGPVATLQSGTVTIKGTAVRDVIAVVIANSRLTVDYGSDGTIDATFNLSLVKRLQVLPGGGDDGVSVLGAGAVPITVKGGTGDDGIGIVGNIGQFGTTDASTTITGDAGNDSLFAATPGPVTIQAGAGDDIVNGGGAGTGKETISLGDGNDLFRASLNTFIGPLSDTVDGGAGKDLLDMQGSFASESVRLSASGGHLIVDHDFNDRIDADNIESVSFLGFGGLDESGAGDTVAVADLSKTDVTLFTPDFSTGQGETTPNNSADTLTVSGTAGVDHIRVSGSGNDISVEGLSTMVTPVALRPQDVLVIDTKTGNDTVDTAGLNPNLVQLRVL
jgi:hypothetical protein